MTSVSAGLVNQKALAGLLGVSSRHVHNLVKLGMPSESLAGKLSYPLADCIAWWTEYQGGLMVEKALAERPLADGTNAKDRLTTALARKAEIEVAGLERRMIPIEESVRETTARLGGLRSNLLAFTSKNAHHLVGCKTIPEVTARLEPAIHDLMTVLAGGEEA